MLWIEVARLEGFVAVNSSHEDHEIVGLTPCSLVDMQHHFRSNTLTASLELIIQGDI